MNVIPYVSLAFYVGILLACILVLTLVESKGSANTDKKYLQMQRQIAALFGILLLVTVFDFVLIHERGVAPSSMYFFNLACCLVELLYMYGFLSHYLFDIDRQMRVIQFFAWVAVVIIPIHPVVYQEFLLEQGYKSSGTAYQEFCQTIAIRIGIWILFIVCILLLGLFIYRLSVSYRQFIRQYVQHFVNREAAVRHNRNFYLFLGTTLVLTIAEYSFMTDYYITLPFWALFDLYVTLLLFRNRRIYDKLMEAYRLDKLAQIRQSLDSENSASVEEQIVKSRLAAWSQRSDAPWMKPNITVVDVANDLNLPVGVLDKYGRILIGCSFKDYIRMLRNETLEGKSDGMI